MERYDIAIIGTGPAGLSAAITATIRNKIILLLGSRDLSAKVQKAHTIQNYLGLPSVSGADLAAAFQRHLDDMGIQIPDERVNAVYSMGDYFAIQAGEQMPEAETVILATGVVPGAIMTESFLSFIGLGVAAPMPSLGSMANTALNGIISYPQNMIYPAVLISLIILCFNILGDALCDALDPKMRK